MARVSSHGEPLDLADHLQLSPLHDEIHAGLKIAFQS